MQKLHSLQGLLYLDTTKTSVQKKKKKGMEVEYQCNVLGDLYPQPPVDRFDLVMQVVVKRSRHEFLQAPVNS